MTLLQIAGGQTWPNFLPLLGYRPDQVIFLASADPKGNYAKSIESMKQAANDLPAPLQIQTQIVSTIGQNPTLQECRAALQQVNPANISLINLTGGTKAMSLAAFLFAQQHKIPTFHLDTRRKEQPFDDCDTAPQPTAFPDWEALSQQINVKTALQCQGFPVPATFKHPLEAHLKFACAAACIRTEQTASIEISKALTTWRKQLHAEDGSKFLYKSKLRTALQQPVTAQPDTAWGRYLLAAAEAEIVEALEPAGEFLLTSLDPTCANSDELRSEAQTRFKLLEGLWFELAVLDHLQSKPEFSDVQWSVEANPESSPSASSKGETDLVAFNHQTLNLHFISCKTTGPHASPLDHIQGLRARATKEGGQFAKAELWIFRPKSEKHRKDLLDHCTEQKVSLRVFTDLI